MDGGKDELAHRPFVEAGQARGRGSYPRHLKRWRSRWPYILFSAVVLVGAFLDLCTACPHLDDKLRAVERATVAQSLVLGGVSVFSVQWPTLLVLEALAGAAYLVATRWGHRALGLRAGVVELNRTMGHLEALFPWVVFCIAFPSLHSVPWSVAAAILGGVVSFGPGVVDRLTDTVTARSHRHERWRPRPEGDPVIGRWRFHLWRRVVLLAASAAGFVLLAAIAPGQSGAILPLLGVFFVGVLFRVTELADRPSDVHAARAAIWARALRAGEAYDLIFLIVSQVALAHFFRGELNQGTPSDNADIAARSEPFRVLPTPAITASEPLGSASGPTPPKAPIRIFVMADTQLHELAGDRSGVQLDLVDSSVPVAVRPVELDLLSIFTVVRFDRTRRELEGRLGQTIPWIHLGDFGDLGCASEIDRMKKLGESLAPPLALAAGNHDSAFIGNFVWHPSWDSACRNESRAVKSATDATLARWSPASEPQSAWGAPYLPGMASLGHIEGTEIVGVFFDTSDETLPSLGIAGVQGAVSGAQIDWVARKLGEHPGALVVFFMHHPFDELSRISRWRIARLADGLAERLLGVVSAHTHLAALRWTTMGARAVPEFVVGSTIDPPQEAAVLEIGKNDAGRVGLRIVTVPAVDRAGATCGDEGDAGLTTKTCNDLRDSVLHQCGELTREVTSQEHPRTPAAVKDAQETRAENLVACLEELNILPRRSRSRLLYSDALTTELDDLATSLAGKTDPDSARVLDDLACLSWAGSVLQGHKASGETYEAALEEATTAGAAFAATTMIADSASGSQRRCGL